MNWFKIAQKSGNIDECVKDKIRTDPFFIALFKRFKIPLDQLNQLKIHTKKLQNSFCEANDEEIIIDERLAHSSGFLAKDFHFVAHEILHWLRRQREKMSYFADPEEIEGFNVGIAYMLNAKDHLDAIVKRFLPLIKINISDDNKAREFLNHRIHDAEKLLSELR